MRQRLNIPACVAFVSLAWPLAAAVAREPEKVAAPVATREFSIVGDIPHLDGNPVKLWGIRWNNALMSPAVTERHVRCLDTVVAHGINLLTVGLQGTNGSFPSVDAGPNAFLPTGALRADFGKRLEWIIREADKRGMVVGIYVLQPRKDQELKDEAAVKRAIEETGRFLTERKLKNVFVNLMHEFSHPVRADHELLREPDGAAKKARLTAWFKAVAPDIEAGVCPNHQSGSADSYPGMEVRFYQEEMPIPSTGFAVNTETHDNDEPGNEGIFNRFHRESMRKDWERYLGQPRLVMVFHSSHIEGVTNSAGTGPNPELGGYGTGPSDRGARFFFEWVRDHVGRWEYPHHILDRTDDAGKKVE
ncbi:hypothetical protein [Singulisphaera sp. PoT]|uniref:hypothetical protein n=1 Tax=Singulisphaera sp. PoT TaxID=3411797 RepID=UPI003BF5AB46